MSVLRVALLFLLVLAAALPAVAQAPARHALLIGNQAYTREVGTLKNPHNDVALIAGALEKIGFKRENIRRVTDADRITILREIDAYGDRLAAAGADAVGFFYYSGHGVANERDQRNYLIPIEVKQLDSAVWYSGVPLDDIIAKLAAQAREASQFVLFDACRNVLNVPSRGSKGFVPIASRRGMLIGFSTDPGQTASDAGVASGPYAAALAAELVKPGQHHLDLFQNVKEQVFKTTKAQVPWERNGLLSRVYLGGSPAPPPSIGPQPQGLSSAAEAVRICRVVETITSLSMLGVLQRQYVGTPAAECLATRVGEIKAAQVAALIASETDRKKAEAERTLAELERKTAALTKQQPAPRPTTTSQAATPRAGETFRDCPTCPEMVVVPAGSFMMGSSGSEEGRDSNEGPQRRVTIAKPFAVGKFEVTFDEWDACMTAGGCTHRPGDQGWGRSRRPVIEVNWTDAKQYVEWLSRATGEGYRLLTESEWEYSARAGTTTPFSTGSTITTRQANFDGSYTYSDSAVGDYRQETMVVGSFAANGFGLHDMHGNVSEWTEDCWNYSLRGAPSDGSPRINIVCTRHVVRGGSWFSHPVDIRSASRDRDLASDKSSHTIGFRVARAISR